MNFHVHKRLIIFITAVLVIVLIILCIVLAREYSKVAPGRIINRDRFSHFNREHIILGPGDTQVITSWMTFEYINHIFSLPPEYLRNTLLLQDIRYPRISLMQYAQLNHMSPDTFTVQVQTAVKNYFPKPTIE